MWEKDYPYVMAGEFDTAEFLSGRGAVPSGRRSREYGRPSFEDETFMREAVEYLESPLVYKRSGLIAGSTFDAEWKTEGDFVDEDGIKCNYGQGGLEGWER